MVTQIGADADRLLGGKPTSALIIDESSFPKQRNSVGVARQWTGRLGKIDNCQVAVFAVLTDGERHTPVDMRLYLPDRWIQDPARCEQAGVPEAARKLTSKSAHALDIVRRARARGIRFAWVGMDGGYGKEPGLLRELDDANEVFVADVHRNQHIWTEQPGLHVPESKPGRGRPSKRRKPTTASITVEKLAKGIPPEDWTRYILRDCTRGELRVDVVCRRVWLWDGKGERPRCWHLIVRREVGSVKTIKYSLSNAPAGTLRLQLAQMQGQRYWIERAFEDGKGECGLADYQALGWRSWTPCRGFLDRADCSALLCRRPRRRDASGIGLEAT